MPSRRRRRDRRGHHGDHPEPASGPRPAAKKADAKRREAFEARMSRLYRARNVVFAGFLLSLAFSIPCIAVGAGCTGLPQSLFPFVSSALLGLVLGYLLRIWREQRAFERAQGS